MLWRDKGFGAPRDPSQASGQAVESDRLSAQAKPSPSKPSSSERGRIVRAFAALAIAALAGGCFQPLYGEHSPTGGPVLREQLSAVDVLQIDAPKGSDESRLAVEI